MHDDWKGVLREVLVSGWVCWTDATGRRVVCESVCERVYESGVVWVWTCGGDGVGRDVGRGGVHG